MAAARDGRALGAQAGRFAVHGQGRRSFESRRPALRILGWYGVAAVLAAIVSVALGHSPLSCKGWLGARGTASLLLSLGVGVPLGAATIAATRVLVRRAVWARALHAALRPAVPGVDDLTIFAVAAASATVEEVFFRGLLLPLVGVVASSIVFGTLHQIGGRARWGWMAWATVMGLLFGTIFAATGSLAGPVVAHAAINHYNLRFLRDNDPSPQQQRLGGLLRR
jgi:hypothetical protein